MQVSLSALRRFAPDLPDAGEVARLLTLGGLEVAAARPSLRAFSGVVVGRVEECSPVEGSKKLSLCRVDAGGHGVFSVVCGAANIEVGQCYPFAKPGAVLPGGLEITERKLADTLSQGMLCSAKELGLGEDADGILPLGTAEQAGADLRELLGGEDVVLHLDLTPDRADCFGAEGIARDAAALAGVAFAPLQVSPVEAQSAEAVVLQIDAPADCSRYCGRVLSGLDFARPSPLWLQEALRHYGVRSISAVVDVTNYVMMELGQPLHAFDFAQIGSNICVRRAAAGEKLQLLDESVLELSSEDLLIASPDAPLALAGVMGGLLSGTDEGTTAIVLESAFFAPGRVRSGRTRHGMNTEASRRFERGVCPQLQRRAIERASELVLQICGGVAGPVSEAVSEAHLPHLPQIELSRDWLHSLLGAGLEPEVVADALGWLGLSPESTDGGWRVQVPSHRFDLMCEEDLIEEVARIVGYDALPEAPPAVGSGLIAGEAAGAADVRVANAEAEQAEQMCDFLAARGWRECISYSFLSPAVCANLFPSRQDTDALKLVNPLADSRAVMRGSLLPGLLESLAHNLHHQEERLRLFELGTCFEPPAKAGEPPQEQMRLALLATGPRHEQSWAADQQAGTDFYDLKGALEALLQASYCRLRLCDPAAGRVPDWLGAFFEDSASAPLLHPGQRALVEVSASDGATDAQIAGQVAGQVAGQISGLAACLHPRVAESAGATGQVFYAELLLSGLPPLSERRPGFQPFARFPRIRRDLSLVMPEDCSAEQLLAIVHEAAGKELTSCRIFDLYRTQGQETQQSVAIAIQWQPTDKTWTSEQADERVHAIVARLKTEGISLRT